MARTDKHLPGRLWRGVQAAGGRLRLRHLAIAALAFYLASLVPLLLLARHNYASVDDFGYTTATHATWAQTGSIGAVLAAAARECVVTWQDWQGSFSAIFLMALQPGVFSDGAYALTTWLMVGALTAGVLLLCRAVLGRLFGAGRAGWLLAGVWVLFFAVQTPPSSVQGFFWYNGSVYYTFIFALALVLFALLIAFAGARRAGGRAACLAGACLLAVVTGGGNYVTALQCILAFALMILLLILNKNRAWRWVLLPLGIHCGCFALSAAAPGNAVRAATEFTHQPSAVGTVLRALASAVQSAGEWLSLPLLAALLLLAPALWRMAAASGVRFRLPVVVSLLSWGFLAAGYCPPLYAMDSTGDGRILNIQYYLFLLLLVFNLFYWLGWLAGKTAAYTADGRRLSADILRALHRLALPGLAGLALLFGLCLVGTGAYRDVTAYSATRSLASGQAAEYGRQMRQRIALVEGAAEDVVAVPPLTVRPRELFFADLNPDPGYFSNIIMAEYYGKARIELLPPEEDPASAEDAPAPEPAAETGS